MVKYKEFQRPRGRPAKDAVYPTIEDYQIQIRLFEPSAEAKQAWLERENAFVLITNLPEAAPASPVRQRNASPSASRLLTPRLVSLLRRLHSA